MVPPLLQLCLCLLLAARPIQSFHLLPSLSKQRCHRSYGPSTSIITSTTSSTFQLHAAGKAPLIFTQNLMTEMVGLVRERVSFSMLPAPLITYSVERILARMSQDLSAATLSSIEQILAAEQTSSEFDDFSAQEIEDLADQVASELCEKSVVDLPMLDKEQELELLQQVMRVIFQVVTTDEEERRNAWIATNMNKGRDLLTHAKSRRQLAQAINEMVDIPLLNEGQEEDILLKAVDACAETLQKLLPNNLLESLVNESSHGLAEMKELLIQKVNAKVDLIGFDEAQEEAIIVSMVDTLIDTYIHNTDAEYLLLNEQEQGDMLQERVKELEWELQASQARYEREQANIQAQLELVKQKIEGLK